ncbi:MAG TPA: MlaD family protein [Thermoanaerobaculia bacterium]|nr:MlaD family protein [Thermoanaerobaculia bacterium]
MSETSRNLRIGIVVSIALVSMMLFLFFIGSKQKLFSRKNEYLVQLDTVSGLAEGNPVNLSGVSIGIIKDITLPLDPKNRLVRIVILVDRKYQERIRGDSRARLKKLGLIAADSYIDISPGTERYPELEPGSLIPSAKQTNVDQLIGQGEDLVDNFVEISYSLKNILGRVDRGEGLLGELTTQPKTKQRLTDTFMATLNKTNGLLDEAQHGQGLIGRLLSDKEYADQLTGSLTSSAQSLQSVLANLQRSFDSGQGALPLLLNDPASKQKVIALIENLRLTSERLALLTESFQNGRGLVPRLLNDRPYADQTLEEFQTLVHRLNETARKLDEGEGSAGRLIADPSVYESINDILIGINESSMLRWLVRSRQQKGIARRYKTESHGKVPAAVTPVPKGSEKGKEKDQKAPPASQPGAENPAAAPPSTTPSVAEPAVPPSTTTSGSSVAPSEAAPPPATEAAPPATQTVVPPPTSSTMTQALSS